MSYETMKRCGGTLNEYYLVKEANLKRLYTIQFQLYDVLENSKVWRRKKVSGGQELGRGEDQAGHRGFLGQ